MRFHTLSSSSIQIGFTGEGVCCFTLWTLLGSPQPRNLISINVAGILDFPIKFETDAVFGYLGGGSTGTSSMLGNATGLTGETITPAAGDSEGADAEGPDTVSPGSADA